MKVQKTDQLPIKENVFFLHSRYNRLKRLGYARKPIPAIAAVEIMKAAHNLIDMKHSNVKPINDADSKPA